MLNQLHAGPTIIVISHNSFVLQVLVQTLLPMFVNRECLCHYDLLKLFVVTYNSVMQLLPVTSVKKLSKMEGNFSLSTHRSVNLNSFHIVSEISDSFHCNSQSAFKLNKSKREILKLRFRWFYETCQVTYKQVYKHHVLNAYSSLYHLANDSILFVDMFDCLSTASSFAAFVSTVHGQWCA